MEPKFDDGLKVLVYGDLERLEATMNHHFLDQLGAVADEITQNPKTISELNQYIRDNNFTHLIVPDEWFHRIQGTLEGCVLPPIELLGDHWIPWAISKKRDYLQKNRIQHAFVFSERFQNPYIDLAEMHSVLQGFNSRVFRDRGGERDIDILVHGSLGEDTFPWVYPVRNWLAEILPEIGIKEGLNVVYWKHPGYWPEKGLATDNIHLEAYASILNRSKIAVGGSGYWRLPFKKFYEVPACGAILISDLPLENTQFFEGRIISISPEKTLDPSYVQDVRRTIVETLENYDTEKLKLQPFRNEDDFFRHSYEGRALEMRKILKTIKP